MAMISITFIFVSEIGPTVHLRLKSCFEKRCWSFMNKSQENVFYSNYYQTKNKLYR